MNRPCVALWGFCTALCVGQKAPIDDYAAHVSRFEEIATGSPGQRTVQQVRGVLPHLNTVPFAQYEAAVSPVIDGGVLALLERLLLNKQVGSTSPSSGTTSLLSSVAVPALAGFSTEYGAILQNSNGSTSTLRTNLLALARPFFADKLPDCSTVLSDNCPPASRWLERFSGLISFENVSTTQSAPAMMATPPAPLTTDLFGNEFRMASWGVHFDITHNNPSAKYVTAWQSAMSQFVISQAPGELGQTVDALFTDPTTHEVLSAYTTWMSAAVPLLQAAPSDTEFRRILDEQMRGLIQQWSGQDSGFRARVSAVRNAWLNYSTVRDELLKVIQSNRVGLEYTNQHTFGQAFTSNLRFIYSHQPSRAPTVLTLNGGVDWYNSIPAGSKTGRFRDIQVAGQLDHRLGEISNWGIVTATLAGYYQWMKDDALIMIGPGNVALGGETILPGTAAMLLGTKGSIGVIQGKVSFPLKDSIKVPVSVTWSNRTELINEKDVRAQIGLTLDLDGLFGKAAK